MLTRFIKAMQLLGSFKSTNILLRDNGSWQEYPKCHVVIILNIDKKLYSLVIILEVQVSST